MPVEITSDFILSVLGAKEVELAALRIKVAQLEQAQQIASQSIGVDTIHSALLRKAKRGGQPLPSVPTAPSDAKP